MSTEKWEDIEGFEGIYQISNFGRVKSLKFNKERILAKRISTGYDEVQLRLNGNCTIKRVHRLVAKVFIKNPFNHIIINHKDGNKLNNHFTNLEWCDYSYNNKQSYLMGFNKTKPVIQMNLKTNEIIRVWNLMKEASEELGVNSSNIRKCILGKNKQCGGFKWKSVVDLK